MNFIMFAQDRLNLSLRCPYLKTNHYTCGLITMYLITWLKVTLNFIIIHLSSISFIIYFGLVFDSVIIMENHITSVHQAGYFHIRTIGAIRRDLNSDIAAQIIHSFVTSNLDYCNSLINFNDIRLTRKIFVSFKKYSKGMGTHSFTVSSPWGECRQFSAAEAIHTIFRPPGTHFCWVDRGSVDSKLAQGLCM